MTVNLWAVMLVRDEADVIEHTIRHVAAQGVEGIIVSDNDSADGTTEILHSLERELDCKLIVIPDHETAYYQSKKTTWMAETAHDLGAQYVWPCDADEIWFHDSGRPLADVISGHGEVIHLDLYTHLSTELDEPSGNPFERMSYRQPAPQPLAKVIVKWVEGCVIHAGNHDAEHPTGEHVQVEGLRIAHCPYRSEDQFVSKAINGSRAYAAAAGLSWDTGIHWREYGQHYERGGEEALRQIYRDHFLIDVPSAIGLVYDPIPLRA